MTRRLAIATAPAVCLLLTANVLHAQRPSGDWMTTGFDAQRSSWVRTDGKISKETMSKPGFEVVWKLKFDNVAKQLNTLTPPALLDFYIGYRGFRALGFFGASNDKIVGVDIDLGKIEWEKSFASGSGSAGTLGCPGGLTSAVTRPTALGYPAAVPPRGAGRGTPAKGGVGEPYEGAVTLKRAPAPPFTPPPAPAKPRGGAGQAAAAAAAANPFAPRIQWLNAITSDGKLHSFYVSNGNEPVPAIPFLPAGANAQGLLVSDGTAYAATTNGCGGADNGVWALDMTSKQVSKWKAPSSVAGTAGPAFDPDGNSYITTVGGELVALGPKTLNQLGAYKAGSAFTSSPLVFEFGGKDIIAATTTDGSLHLASLDGIKTNTVLAKSAPFSAAGYATGALASWVDSNNQRWIFAPAGGATATSAGFSASNGDIKSGTLVAWKVVDKGGAPALEPGWVSRDLVSPLPPIIVNGVVFVLSSGEFRTADAKVTAAQRAQKSVPAVLYALDPANGKEIWNSGKALTSFVHSGGLSAGGGRVYVGTYEGTQYTFSFPMEH